LNGGNESGQAPLTPKPQLARDGQNHHERGLHEGGRAWQRVLCAGARRQRRRFAGRNDSLEVGVVERMILDVHGEPPFALLGRESFRQSPGAEYAVHFEPEVVMQMARGVFLDDEMMHRPLVLLHGATGFRGFLEIALCPIRFHIRSFARGAPSAAVRSAGAPNLLS